MSDTAAARKPVDPCTLLAMVPKPGGKRHAEIRITTARRRCRVVNLRIWVMDDDGTMRPTRKGVTFATDKAEAVRDAMALACKRLGLDDE